MTPAIYALKINDDIVYVGQSIQAEFRIGTHLSDIAGCRGLAARYPHVFRGQTVTACVLELVQLPPEPPDPVAYAANDETWEADFQARYAWEQARRDLMIERELHYIQLHRPRCNKRGLQPVQARLTLDSLPQFAVTCPDIAVATNAPRLAV